MKKLIRFLVRFLLIGLMLGIAGFLLLALYYRDKFPVNTWINGVYCTGKTVEQVNAELVKAWKPPVISVVGADLTCGEIDAQDINIRPDYVTQLSSYLNRNSMTGWLANLENPVMNEIVPLDYVMDEEKLRACFETLPFVAEEKKRAGGVELVRSEEGYSLIDGNSDRLNFEKAYLYFRDCVRKGETAIRIPKGCYEALADDNSDKAMRDIWEKICDFTERSGRIVYDMGAESIAFTPGLTVGFLETDSGGIPSVDGDGKLIISEAAVLAWVEQLAADYSTSGTEREFLSTRGDIVKVKYGTYGTKLDADAEKAYLLEALRADVDSGAEPDTENAEAHVPKYRKQGFVRGLDDIGSTYIEIDMTNQKMYYYEEGELALETDVVTGNLSRGMGTPAGIHYVHSKNRNCVLRGSDYESFVKYWVPVNGGIGIHDASWRSKFGGEIYKTNGSHGCINTPTELMAQLYDKMEVGLPVVMFY